MHLSIFSYQTKMNHDLVLFALTAVFFLAASIFWYSWVFKNSTPPPLPLPPGPRGLPIVGYLPFMKADLHLQFTELAHKYGPIYRLWLGSKLYIVVTCPSLIKQVVRDHDTVFANRDPPVAALVATGGLDILWAPSGPYWHDMRKLFVRELLSAGNLLASSWLRREEVAKAVGSLSTMIGQPVEIGELIFRTESRVILRLISGGGKYMGAEIQEAVAKVVDLFGKPNISDFFPGLAKFDVQGIAREMRDVVSALEQILDSIIDERIKTMAADGEGEEEDQRRKDFVGILLELKDQKIGGNSLFGPTQIRSILLDVILGGTDTTTTIAEWVMTELLRNPDVMKKVQRELTDVVGANNVVEESHLPKLHYLEAAVKETFRLHPPLPHLVPRCPAESCTIGGYTIPKGSRIFLNMWSVYTDPNVWDTPFEFRPDRFLNNDSGKKFSYIGHNFEYLPFGSGRRACPGLPLGEKMVMFLLATLVHSFQWQLPAGREIDMSAEYGIVMRKRRPLVAIPYKRDCQM
ncbi:hypothetical protein ABFS82_04G164700 [Erythranthe guttata]|uniref:Cytochrome P450 n=1 Tax=Erythranthe guttata TaxID=4155 RepID=A0A022QNK4_ERYGU|nr:PREDICTED: cytochrome P450 76C1-like [Erythranthe guttata]EYU29506.1 hypothetical protein MIMGU_mgv1a004621mg [Erythranthe guttata]|eukprot:XP_012846821.1 PREDICTED: cytochrome P450 76C1-like [Erythranthe guttata]